MGSCSMCEVYVQVAGCDPDHAEFYCWTSLMLPQTATPLPCSSGKSDRIVGNENAVGIRN